MVVLKMPSSLSPANESDKSSDKSDGAVRSDEPDSVVCSESSLASPGSLHSEWHSEWHSKSLHSESTLVSPSRLDSESLRQPAEASAEGRRPPARPPAPASEGKLPSALGRGGSGRTREQDVVVDVVGLLLVADNAELYFDVVTLCVLLLLLRGTRCADERAFRVKGHLEDGSRARQQTAGLEPWQTPRSPPHLQLVVPDPSSRHDRPSSGEPTAHQSRHAA